MLSARNNNVFRGFFEGVGVTLDAWARPAKSVRDCRSSDLAKLKKVTELPIVWNSKGSGLAWI